MKPQLYQNEIRSKSPLTFIQMTTVRLCCELVECSPPCWSNYCHGHKGRDSVIAATRIWAATFSHLVKEYLKRLNSTSEYKVQHEFRLFIKHETGSYIVSLTTSVLESSKNYTRQVFMRMCTKIKTGNKIHIKISITVPPSLGSWWLSCHNGTKYFFMHYIKKL